MDEHSDFLKGTIIPEDYLHLTEEEAIDNLQKLIESLEEMDEGIFAHYVTKAHHNIADWILEGYHNEKLSKKVRKILKKEKIIKVLKKELLREKEDIKAQEKKALKKISIPKSKGKILKEISQLNDSVFTKNA